jgi:hypothetical protein
MMRSALCLAVTLCGATEARASGVFVDAGTLTASVAVELALEGRTISTSTAGAAAIARLWSDAGALEVEVRSPSGSLIAARRVPIEAELSAALRIAVLVIADATRPGPVARTATTAPEVASAPPPIPQEAGARLGLSLAASLGSWSLPAAPSLGLVLSGVLELEVLRLELGLGVDGLCCAVRRPDVIEARSLELSLRGTVGLVVWSAGPLDVLILGGAGLSLRRVESTVLAFAAAAPTETQVGVEALLRAGGGLEWRTFPGGPRLGLRGGASLRFGRLTVRLPEPYSSETAAIDPGIINAWTELGATQFF